MTNNQSTASNAQEEATCSFAGILRTILCLGPVEKTAANSLPTPQNIKTYRPISKESEELARKEEEIRALRLADEKRAEMEELEAAHKRDKELDELKKVLNNNAIINSRESKAADTKMQRELDEMRLKISCPVSPRTKTALGGSSHQTDAPVALSIATDPLAIDPAVFDRLADTGINCVFYLPSRNGCAKPKPTLLRCPRREGVLELVVQTNASSARTKTLTFDMALEIVSAHVGKGPLIALPDDVVLDNVMHILLINKPEISVSFIDRLTMSMVVTGLNRHILQNKHKIKSHPFPEGSVASTYSSRSGGLALSGTNTPTVYSPRKGGEDNPESPRNMSPKGNGSNRSTPRGSSLNLMSKDMLKLSSFFFVGASKKGFLKSEIVTKLLLILIDGSIYIYLAPKEFGFKLESSGIHAEQEQLKTKLKMLCEAQWSPSILIDQGFILETELSINDLAQTSRAEDTDECAVELLTRDEKSFVLYISEPHERKQFIQLMEAKRRSARSSAK